MLPVKLKYVHVPAADGVTINCAELGMVIWRPRTSAVALGVIVLFRPLKVSTPEPVVVIVPIVQLKAPVTVMFAEPVKVPLPVTDRLAIVTAAILLVRSLFSNALAPVIRVTPPE